MATSDYKADLKATLDELNLWLNGLAEIFNSIHRLSQEIDEPGDGHLSMGIEALAEKGERLVNTCIAQALSLGDLDQKSDT